MNDTSWRQRSDAIKRRDIDDASVVTEVFAEALRIHQRGDGVANGRHIDDASANIETHGTHDGRTNDNMQNQVPASNTEAQPMDG